MTVIETSLIEEHWKGIGDRQFQMVELFYQRLFARFPKYRKLFPDIIDSQMEKMVATLARLAGRSNGDDSLHQHIASVGERHRKHDLSRSDVYNFISVLLETLGEYNTQCWSPECEKAWGQALENVILPHVFRGMQEE